MIIECDYCSAKVFATVIAKKDFLYPPDKYGSEPPYKVSLLECPSCKTAIVALQALYDTGPNTSKYDTPLRVWPNPSKRISLKIPVSVRNSLEEATKCYKAKAYSACAVMCGRALEAIGKEHQIKGSLFEQLKVLKDKKNIDEKIYNWAEELRTYRNLGAHATDHSFTEEEAKDLLDFIDAICDYIYVLTDKYNSFIKRKQKK